MPVSARPRLHIARRACDARRTSSKTTRILTKHPREWICRGHKRPISRSCLTPGRRALPKRPACGPAGRDSPADERPRGARPAFMREAKWGGDPGRARTCDLPLRRRLLYPAELRGHVDATAPVSRSSASASGGGEEIGTASPEQSTEPGKAVVGLRRRSPPSASRDPHD